MPRSFLHRPSSTRHFRRRHYGHVTSFFLHLLLRLLLITSMPAIICFIRRYADDASDTRDDDC